MAGMATYLDVLRILNELPGGAPALPNLPPTAPVVAPTSTPPGPPPVNASAAFSLPPVAPPAAPLPGLDEGLISRLSGPAPVAPVVRPASRFDRIMAAIGGVGAGLQGRGQEFVEGIREQRARPMREFKVEQERFQQRRAGATEFAERRRGQQQEQTQRIAERQSEREFERWLQAGKIENEEAKTAARQAFEIQKLRESERIADERQAVQEQKQLRLKAADLAAKYRLAGAKQFANELAQRDVGLTDKVSPAADKWLSSHVQLEQARLNRLTTGGTGRGGGTKAQQAIEQFEAIKQKLIEAAATGNAKAQQQLMLDLNRAFRGLARFPEIEAGFDPSGKWPYAKLRTPAGSVGLVPQQQPTAQAQPAGGKAEDPLGIR